MAWIRLSDDYNDHPKFNRLSDGAFRLWHQAMGFCRKYQTDGVIPMTDLRGFKAYSPKRCHELVTPWQAGAQPLWDVIDGTGYKVHDYLFWNPSKDEENERRAESKERMRVLREQRKTAGVAPSPSPPVCANTSQTFAERSQNVPGWEGKKVLEKKELSNADQIDDRARELMEAYPVWYAQERHGARHKLVGGNLEFIDAKELVALWDDERLEKLARIFLTTDDQWISTTDRGFRLFAKKAQWADDRLKQWERGRERAS